MCSVAHPGGGNPQFPGSVEEQDCEDGEDIPLWKVECCNASEVGLAGLARAAIKKA